jgi:transposase
VRISTARTCPERSRSQGDLPNYKNLGEEPPDHAVGRSRGGLSTKIHQLCDGNGRPLVVLLGPGQGSDSRMFPHLLHALRVHRRGRGRPRTTPDAVLGDKAYSSRGHRALLRRRGITAVIAEPQDQKANRTRRGAKGGRPPAFKQWRALATRYDKLALTYRAGALLRAVLIWLDALGDAP